MRLDKVRVGERFVFDHVGGVYMKVSNDRARCIYGRNFGREERIIPDVSVYVIFEDRDKLKRKPMLAVKPVSSDTMMVPDKAIEQPKVESTEQPKVESVVPTPEVPQPVIPTPISEGGLRMLLVDEDEKVLVDMPNATAAQIAAYTDAGGIRLRAGHNGRNVLETIVDHTSQTFYIVLGNEV